VRLCEALGLGAREVVALVGAGGKTGSLFRLAQELRSAERTVIATTTTHMFPPPDEAGWPVLVDSDASARTAAAAQAVAAQGRAFVATELRPDGRLQGIAPQEVDALAALADVVLVEADGARGLWLKAPAAHEPVIPPAATLIVPIAGLQALGRPLDEEVVHRPERVAALLDLDPGATIDEEMLAALFLHSDGALRGAPASARVVAFCNQADDQGARAAGQRIAARTLRARGRIRRLVVGSLHTAPEGCEAWAPTAVVILAAGGAERYGRLKQAELWQGLPFLTRAVEAALGSLATEVQVVLGCQAERLAALIAGHDPARLRVTVNPEWREGQATSIRAGLAALGDDVEAAVFCTADQPLLTAAEIDALLMRHAATGATIVAPRLGGELRSPVLFARRLFAELGALEGDTGGRAVIRRHGEEVDAIDVRDPRPYTDVDTEHDYRQLLDGGN
jgi:molybdenum cofactor cytidylyltransferase